MTNGNSIVYLFWLIVGMNSCFGLVLPCLCFFRWNNVWRVLALFPIVILGAAFGTIYYKVTHDPRSHNLWPFEIFFWGVGSWGYCLFIDWIHVARNKNMN